MQINLESTYEIVLTDKTSLGKSKKEKFKHTTRVGIGKRYQYKTHNFLKEELNAKTNLFLFESISRVD